jgi:formamidopyrimidine-DNA glycosylase
MPELPEVETIKRGLDQKIVGQTFSAIQILNPKSFQGIPREVINKKILKVWRRAKNLGIDLDGGISLLAHLKMSGQLVLESSDRFVGGHPTKDMLFEMPNKSTRIIFEISDGSKLYFNDQRKFGWIKQLKTEDCDFLKGEVFKKLGPEPLEKDFTWDKLKENLLRHKGMPIKVALLDQSVVSGVGNIYANEGCFNAKIDPRRAVNTLSDEEFAAIYKGTIKALEDGIKYGGSTKTHFVNSDGKKGYFLDHAYLYNRDGENCKICGTKIEKFKLGGRGTYVCPSCQK